MKGLLGLFFFWIRVSNKYDRLKNDPAKQNSASLGITSIIMSIFGVITSIGLAYFAYLCLSVDNLAIVISFIFGFAAAIGAILCFFQLLVASLFYAIYQMKLNNRVIGKVALSISLIMLAAAIGMIIFVVVNVL